MAAAIRMGEIIPGQETRRAMATLTNVGRIDCSGEDAHRAIVELRRQLSPRGDLVSPEGRARTIAAFGEPLTPEQVVRRICDDVRDRGLEAVLDYTARLDRVELEPSAVRVSADELAEAYKAADPAYLRTIRRVRENILAFQSGILHRDARFRRGPGCELRLRYRPLRRVGLCIPGGAAAYPSSLLMTAVPAQAAGVPEIAVVVPPTPFGGYNVDLLAACHALGVTEVHRVGGAQAVAALAYGVEGIEPEILPKVFERFCTTQTPRTGARGTGLGRALVKSVVQVARGSVEARSERGKGSEFIVRLPVVR